MIGYTVYVWVCAPWVFEGLSVEAKHGPPSFSGAVRKVEKTSQNCCVFAFSCRTISETSKVVKSHICLEGSDGQTEKWWSKDANTAPKLSNYKVQLNGMEWTLNGSWHLTLPRKRAHHARHLSTYRIPLLEHAGVMHSATRPTWERKNSKIEKSWKSLKVYTSLRLLCSKSIWAPSTPKRAWARTFEWKCVWKRWGTPRGQR